MASAEGIDWAVQVFNERLGEAGESRVVLAMDLAGRSASSIRETVDGTRICLLTDSGTERSENQQEALAEVLEKMGLGPEFVGTYAGGRQQPMPVAVCRGPARPTIATAPPEFKVTAIIPAFNEEDIIEATIGHLTANGVEVYLLDNWSTDQTLERALRWEGRGLLGYERFPAEGPSDVFDLSALQERVESIAAELDADWVVNNDADELRSPPWEGVTLRDGLYHVQQEGYTAVNYTALNFALTDDTYVDGADPAEHLHWFRFEPGYAIRLNTWRREAGVRAELAWSGGHTVRFPGVRTFPYNFLLRHYPIRSVAQGRRKIFTERLPRFPVDERLRGWHSHYDHLKRNEVLQPTAGLIRYDEDFAQQFLLERLAGRVPESSVTLPDHRTALIGLLRRSGQLERLLRLRWRLSGKAAR